jgi:NAD+ synthase (glutamine-hydrolysing)
MGQDNVAQSDEVEMGMTYEELSVYGRLRKVEKCGPYGMFGKLVIEWGSFLSPVEVSFLGHSSVIKGQKLIK